MAEPAQAGHAPPAACGNCGAPLSGPYCSRCGQHAHHSVRSLAVLLHEAWHITTHLDGRFWLSMYYLLLRPGRLTREYFEDHRARFLPPVRIYVVLSVIFFASLLSVPHLHSAHAPASGRASPAEPAASAAAGAPASVPAPKQSGDDDDDEDFGASGAREALVGALDGVGNCARMHSSAKWMEAGLKRTCDRYGGSIAQPVVDAFYHNLPRMMVVMAPLLAVAMLLLYWRPRRYYVEHVVFLLHNHAAIFLISIVSALIFALAAYARWPIRAWIFTATTLYMIWYVYTSMRVHYGQGRFLTLSKMAFMYVVYLVALVSSIIVTILISLITA